MARIKDFIPYVTKIKASGAQAVITGNWGNDLTLLVRAARDLGYEGKFYTFYGNALGAPAAIGDAGIGKVIAVADWFPNAPGAESRRFYESFRERLPNPADDYVHLRMQLMIEALRKADLAAATEAAIVDVLVHKSLAALRATGLQRLVVAGGVGANQRLRQRLGEAAARHGWRLHYPEVALCTDNGAMIALAAAMRWQAGLAPLAPADGAFDVAPRWPLEAVTVVGTDH